MNWAWFWAACVGLVIEWILSNYIQHYEWESSPEWAHKWVESRHNRSVWMWVFIWICMPIIMAGAIPVVMLGMFNYSKFTELMNIIWST